MPYSSCLAKPCLQKTACERFLCCAACISVISAGNIVAGQFEVPRLCRGKEAGGLTHVLELHSVQIREYAQCNKLCKRHFAKFGSKVMQAACCANSRARAYLHSTRRAI